MPKKGNWRRTEHERRHECRCEWCQTVFLSARELARTCSPSCRQALSRDVRRRGGGAGNGSR